MLVGHSMAGVVIAAAAERAPERVRRLVFVTAYLPADGQSFADLARQDTESIARATKSEDGAFTRLDEDILVQGFYSDSPAADAAFARARLVAQSLAPLRAPVRLTAERFGRVPRAYIACRRDRAITLAQQRRMLRATPCDSVIELDCDHSPFFSQPRQLADALLAV
jgi:pimeloyl-ACP methyl ester carboxylesterase